MIYPCYLLLVLLPLTLATNYNQYIDELSKRSALVHDSFMDLPGVREEVGQNLADYYYDDGKYNALPVDVNDAEVDAYWSKLLNSLEKVREQRTSGGNVPNEDNNQDDDDDLTEEEAFESARRQETPYMNSLWGEQKVSGGSDKVQASAVNEQANQSKAKAMGGGGNHIKTDKLPSYCNPPNPCPIGVDAAKLTAPCDKVFKNTKPFNKNWNWSEMQRGECSCDKDHMWSCPANVESRSSQNNMAKKGIKTRNPYFNSGVHQTVQKKAGRELYQSM